MDSAASADVRCLMKCMICGKVSDDSIVCCALSPYELALNQHAGYEHISLQYFLDLPKLRKPGVVQHSLFVARLSIKRESGGDKGTYIDLAGDYDTMGKALFYNHKLTPGDQYRISIMMFLRSGGK